MNTILIGAEQRQRVIARIDYTKLGGGSCWQMDVIETCVVDCKYCPLNKVGLSGKSVPNNR